jgi:hypothetical protein
MPRALVSLREYARVGAEQRLREIENEIRQLFVLFPGLEQELGVRARARGKSRKRRRMSAAQRKAASDRMRKYWAGRKRTKRPRKGMISPEGRKRIAEAQKRRWAAYKAKQA